MDPEKKRLKSIISKHFNLENIFIGVTILLGIIVIINIVLTHNLNQELKKSTEVIQEKLKPAKIELTIVQNSKCSDCFDISTAVNHIKNANVNISRESTVDFSSQEGKSLIKKYGLGKLPSVIIKGEIEKLAIQGLEKKGDALIFSQISPPYTDASTGKTVGKVVLLHLKDPACEKCNDLTALINQLRAAGVKIAEEKIIEPGSDEGKELIKKYNIDFAPTIILSQDAGSYELIQQAWGQIGSRETDGAYVFRGGAAYPQFPSMNLTTGKLRGLVNIVYLADKSCAECYDVNRHREILVQGFSVKLDKEEAYDISDAKGKELAAKYNITKVPTVILSDEMGAYPSSQALRQFFSVEKDNAYVFRQVQSVGTYKDLATGQVVKVE